MKSTKKYHPIDCNLYDYLEAVATLRKEVEIIYSNNESSDTMKGVVTDLIILDKVEHLRLNDSLNIRLDEILSFDGIDFRNRNDCHF